MCAVQRVHSVMYDAPGQLHFDFRSYLRALATVRHGAVRETEQKDVHPGMIARGCSPALSAPISLHQTRSV
jgi:hypothetical protein